MLKFILDRGDVHVKDNHGWTPLFRACKFLTYVYLLSNQVTLSQISGPDKRACVSPDSNRSPASMNTCDTKGVASELLAFLISPFFPITLKTSNACVLPVLRVPMSGHDLPPGGFFLWDYRKKPLRGEAKRIPERLLQYGNLTPIARFHRSVGSANLPGRLDDPI